MCLEHPINLVTAVPRTCAIRQALEAWGRQQPALPLLVAKPGRTQDEEVRCWHGQVVVRSSQLAHQQTQTYGSGQAKEAEAVADHVTRVQARWLACLPDAEAAVAE